MSDSIKPYAASFTINVVVDVSPVLRELLTHLLRPATVPAPDTASRAATGVVGKRRQAASEPGSGLLDVSSQQPAPAAVQTPPPAASSKPRRTIPGDGAVRLGKYDTPERLAWLTSAWRDGVRLGDAVAELNKFPGVVLPAGWAVREIVKRHRLKRSPEVTRQTHLRVTEHMRSLKRGGRPDAPAPAAPVVAAPPPPPAPKQAARGMTAAEVAAKRNATPPKPRRATSIEILRWGAEHGCHQDELDLDVMNARCRRLGVAEFELIGPGQRKAA